MFCNYANCKIRPIFNYLGEKNEFIVSFIKKMGCQCYR